jgi:hypothetical protein
VRAAASCLLLPTAPKRPPGARLQTPSGHDRLEDHPGRVGVASAITHFEDIAHGRAVAAGIRAGFADGKVDFRAAGFSGGTVGFSVPRDWSVPPTFPWPCAH